MTIGGGAETGSSILVDALLHAHRHFAAIGQTNLLLFQTGKDSLDHRRKQLHRIRTEGGDAQVLEVWKEAANGAAEGGNVEGRVGDGAQQQHAHIAERLQVGDGRVGALLQVDVEVETAQFGQPDHCRQRVVESATKEKAGAQRHQLGEAFTDEIPQAFRLVGDDHQIEAGQLGAHGGVLLEEGLQRVHADVDLVGLFGVDMHSADGRPQLGEHRRQVALEAEQLERLQATEHRQAVGQLHGGDLIGQAVEAEGAQPGQLVEDGRHQLGDQSLVPREAADGQLLQLAAPAAGQQQQQRLRLPLLQTGHVHGDDVRQEADNEGRTGRIGVGAFEPRQMGEELVAEVVIVPLPVEELDGASGAEERLGYGAPLSTDGSNAQQVGHVEALKEQPNGKMAVTFPL